MCDVLFVFACFDRALCFEQSFDQFLCQNNIMNAMRVRAEVGEGMQR